MGHLESFYINGEPQVIGLKFQNSQKPIASVDTGLIVREQHIHIHEALASLNPLTFTRNVTTQHQKQIGGRLKGVVKSLPLGTEWGIESRSKHMVSDHNGPPTRMLDLDNILDPIKHVLIWARGIVFDMDNDKLQPAGIKEFKVIVMAMAIHTIVITAIIGPSEEPTLSKKTVVVRRGRLRISARLWELIMIPDSDAIGGPIGFACGLGVFQKTESGIRSLPLQDLTGRFDAVP